MDYKYTLTIRSIETMENNNIWDDAFQKENMIWGIEPSEIAKMTEKVFSKNNVKKILVIGAGYGRNAKYFSDKNYIVDGIEYSKEAIEIGKTFAPQVNFIYSSILDYNKKYDGIFCHSFIHLFKKKEKEIIIDLFNNRRDDIMTAWEGEKSGRCRSGSF
jgi:SAM-dependent methyltransferase